MAVEVGESEVLLQTVVVFVNEEPELFVRANVTLVMTQLGVLQKLVFVVEVQSTELTVGMFHEQISFWIEVS